MTKSYGINIKYSKITPELAVDLIQLVDTSTLKGTRDHALLLVIATGMNLSDICLLKLADVATHAFKWPDAVYTAVYFWCDMRTVQSMFVFTTFARHDVLTATPMTVVSIWEIIHSYTGEH
jgi:hypothetical protein